MIWLTFINPLLIRYQLREGVRRNALRVLRPKRPHSEEIAQYIEWRDPCGHAAVWLQGSTVQGRYDRPRSIDTFFYVEVRANLNLSAVNYVPYT